MSESVENLRLFVAEQNDYSINAHALRKEATAWLVTIDQLQSDIAALREGLADAADVLMKAHREAVISIREFDGGEVHCSEFSSTANRLRALLNQDNGSGE